MADKIKITEPNGGKHIAIAGNINSILASKDDTGGTYGVVEIKVFPDSGPTPHIQTREHEGFYILEGEITFTVEGKEIIAKSGSFVNVPPNVTHSFTNKMSNLAKILVILAPGGLENLFIELGNEVSDIAIPPPPLSEDKTKKFVSLLSKYGVKIPD